jgi:hypothetical protein
MLVRTGTGFSNVTTLLPVAMLEAALTAVTVTEPEAGTVPGAVYTPVELIVPVETLPPSTPFTCQVTPVFDVPITLALKAWGVPARTLGLAGDTVTVTADPGGVEDPPEFEFEDVGPFVAPVHPARPIVASRNAKRLTCGKTSFVALPIERQTKSAVCANLPAFNYDRVRGDELLYGGT